MADIKMVKITYTPPGENKEPWVRTLEEAHAAKVVKQGRWKYVDTPAAPAAPVDTTPRKEYDKKGGTGSHSK